MNEIQIPLSKIKILLLLFGAFGFIVLGALFIFSPDKFVSPIMRSLELIRIIGIVGVLFFGAVGIYGITKVFDNTIGLTIDDNGITDNTNASSIGLIKWIDITEVKTEQVASTKVLLIYTKNPSYYLDMTKGFKRKLMEGNNRMFGTPLSITSNTLKCSFDDLEKLIIDRLNQQRKGMPNL